MRTCRLAGLCLLIWIFGGASDAATAMPPPAIPALSPPDICIESHSLAYCMEQDPQLHGAGKVANEAICVATGDNPEGHGAGAACNASIGAHQQANQEIESLRNELDALIASLPGTVDSYRRQIEQQIAAIQAQIDALTGGEFDDAAGFANQDPIDPTTPATSDTPADGTLSDKGYEADPSEAVAAEEGVSDPSADSLLLYLLPRDQARAVGTGRLTVAEGAAAARVAGYRAYTCGLSFRRKITKIGYMYRANFGARFSCNTPMDYMKFRSRLVFIHQDNNPLVYGSLVDKGGFPGPYPINEFSGNTLDFTFNPRLVVYMSGSITFPTPYDPKAFYTFGVAADPRSVAGLKNLGRCHRVGKTYQVQCDNVRSVSFAKA